MRDFHNSLLSITTSRYLASLTSLLVLLHIFIFKIGYIYHILLCNNFEICFGVIDCKFVNSHPVFNFSSLKLILYCRLSALLSLAVKIGSSANKFTSNFFALERSLIHRSKSSRPSVDPYDISHFMSHMLDFILFNIQGVRKVTIQSYKLLYRHPVIY